MIKPIIILARPQLGENIGAAARAMLNFGCDELRVISPRDGWPNQKAIDSSAGATEVIKNAKIYDTLEDAISDVNFVFATSARDRYLNKISHNIKSLPSEIKAENYAILFGPERTGLSNEEISLADQLIYIPTDPRCPSINLAQSVSLICYELSKSECRMGKTQQDLAKQEEVIAFFSNLESELEKANFFKVLEKKPGMIHNIRGIFKRIYPLTSQDIRTLHGIIKALTIKDQ